MRLRVKERYRILAAVLGASLLLQSVFSVVLALRVRGRVRVALSECERVKRDTLDALAAVRAAVVAVEQAPVADAAERVDADAAAPAPTRHVRGAGNNGRFLYADIETDYHDGEPPTVHRIYQRIPNALRDPRFRTSDASSTNRLSGAGA